ncbi:hypothetical protein H0H93_010418, partial [Arthromyces matolae]
MPDIVRTDWVTRFLPTLYHLFLCSGDPHGDYLSSRAIVPFQRVANLVWPNEDIRVTVKSELFKKAMERTNEFRSRFGTQAIKIVAKFFKDSKFGENPAEIVRYVKWALRPEDGTLLYRIPGPQRRLKDPNGELIPGKGQDFFQSPFIIQLVSPMLKCLQGSSGRGVFGEPRAAFALAAAALERAFLLWETGSETTPKTSFGSEHVRTTVLQYIKNCDRFSERRWTALKEATGATNMTDIEDGGTAAAALR